MKFTTFFVICFCSSFLFSVGLKGAQNTKDIETQTNNPPVETFGPTRKQNGDHGHRLFNIKHRGFAHYYSGGSLFDD